MQFQFSPAGAGAWSNIGAADISPPYAASWNTDARRRRPVRPARRRHRHDRQRRQHAASRACRRRSTTPPRPAPSPLPPAAPTSPAAIAVDASATDGAAPPASGVSAVRFEVKPAGAGAYSVFGTQTAPVVGSTYRQTLATTALADGLAELRVVVTDVAGNETTSAMSTINVDNDAPVVTLDDPGAAVGASVNLTASSSADTVDVTFRYRPGRHARRRHRDRLGRHGAVRRHLDDGARRRAAVGADRRRDRRRRQRHHERTARRPRRPHAAHRQRHRSHGRRERRRPGRRSGRNRGGPGRLRRDARRVAGQGVRRRRLHHRRERHDRPLRRHAGTRRLRPTAPPISARSSPTPPATSARPPSSPSPSTRPARASLSPTPAPSSRAPCR